MPESMYSVYANILSIFSVIILYTFDNHKFPLVFASMGSTTLVNICVCLVYACARTCPSSLIALDIICSTV